MRIRSLAACSLSLLSLPVLLLGCSAGGSEDSSSGGGANTGGAASAGGSGPGGSASGGNAATGGSAPTGGQASSGGQSSSGGALSGGASAGGGAQTGGASATGGSTGSGGAPSLDDLVPNATCTIELTDTVAEKISTVGVVTFTTDLGAVDGGYIDFGLDETYGMRAPLDTGAEGYKTLLLGMTQDSEFHYRVVAKSGDQICSSDDGTITTGSAPAGIPSVTFSAKQADKITPGFLITSNLNLGGGGGGGGGASYALIYNHNGELVWWYESPVGATSRAALSYDSKWMYVRDANPGGGTGGKASRIAMDGSVAESLDVPRGHHDLCIVPDGALFLSGGGTDSCGEIVKITSDGTKSTVYDIREAFGDTFQGSGNDPCHCNSIHYNDADDSISFSCLNQNAYVKIGADGELKWRLGGNGSQSQFTGDIDWNRQHGHHMVSPNHIVFFNNNGLGGNQGDASLAVELELDLDNMTATRTRAYDGAHSSMTFGDTQILESENLLVTYCNDGFIREVDSTDQAVAEWTFTGGVGYAIHRASLYGAPPRF